MMFFQNFKTFARPFLPLQLQGEVAEGRRGFPEARLNPYEMGLCVRPNCRGPTPNPSPNCRGPTPNPSPKHRGGGRQA